MQVVSRKLSGERRVIYSDLVGAAPSIEESRAFLGSSDPDAYGKLVERDPFRKVHGAVFNYWGWMRLLTSEGQRGHWIPLPRKAILEFVLSRSELPAVTYSFHLALVEFTLRTCGDDALTPSEYEEISTRWANFGVLAANYRFETPEVPNSALTTLSNLRLLAGMPPSTRRATTRSVPSSASSRVGSASGDTSS